MYSKYRTVTNSYVDPIATYICYYQKNEASHSTRKILVWSCEKDPESKLSQDAGFNDKDRAVESEKCRCLGGSQKQRANDYSTTERGKEAFTLLDIVFANIGSIYSIRKGRIGSVVNIIFASSAVMTEITPRVSEHFTHSDYLAILFRVLEPALPNVKSRMRYSRNIRSQWMKQWSSKLFGWDI